MTKTGMSLLILVLMVSCLLVLNPAFAATTSDSWVSKASMPAARAYLGVAMVNHTIYAIHLSLNAAYDTVNDTWVTETTIPDSSSQGPFAVAACQGKIYCMGGMPIGFSGASNVNMVYDPATDSWETKAAMPTARYGIQAQVVNDKIYLIGGQRLLGYGLGYERLNVTEIYDPVTDTWSTGSAMPILDDAVTAVVDDKIYVFGSVTQIYDPKTDSWSVGAPPLKNGYVAAATTGAFAPKRIYLYDWFTMQVYDPKGDSWTNGTAPSGIREGVGIGVVDDKLYFIGGRSHPIAGMGIYFVDLDANSQYTPDGYVTPAPSESQSTSEPFPVLPIVGAVVAVAVVSGVVIYIKKRHRVNGKKVFQHKQER
jgi:hypothetical protein